jgi:hypothetical protein
MSVLQQLTTRLAALESRLADRPAEASEIRAIRAHLADADNLWIGTREARRLAGVDSVAAIKAWARLGLLRSRKAPDGRLLVQLDDVLKQRQVQDDLGAMGSVDTPLTEELRAALRQPPAPEVDAIVKEMVARAAEQVPTPEPVGVE